MADAEVIRSIRVTIVKPLPDEFFKTNPLNAIVIEDLRVSFKCEKTLKSEPNKSEVMIYNLSAHTRAEIQKLPLYVIVEAGYNGHLEKIFEGDLRYSFSKQNFTDATWETKLEIDDGGRAFKHAYVSRAYRPGASAKALVADVAKSMGLTIPKNAAGARELIKKFSSGATLEGPSAEQMTKLLKPHGMGWSVQDGRLQILGGGALEGTAFVISSDSGMMGSPEFTSPSKPGEPPTLKIKHRLYPALTPGRKIQPRSRAIPAGLFRLSKVTHTGDNFANDFATDIEATPL